MKRGSSPTWTKLVEDALRGCDDFLSYAMLSKITGGNPSQVSAACFSLRHYRVVDCIIQPDGVAWWYALPREEDTRLRTVEERVPEANPRKRRTKKQIEAQQAALRG